MGKARGRSYRLSVGLGLGLLLMVSLHAPAAAAPAPAASSGGITVSPAFQDVTILPDETSKTFSVKLTNNTPVQLEFSLAMTDFGSLDESGGVLFAGKQQNTLTYRYGLTSWATLQKDRVVLDSHATVEVPVVVDNKESLTPGGHYGAILITPVQTDDDPTKVSIHQELSSLLFVKKQGGETYRLGLQSITVHPHLFTAPDSLTLRFQNGGNVHIVPRGLITVTDPRGRVVKQGIVNDGSAIILPQSFRQIRVPLTGMARAWMPGRYTLKVAYRYDGSSSLQYMQTSFYYVNGWYVLGPLLCAAAFAVLVFNGRTRRVIFRGPRRVLRAVFRCLKIGSKS